MAIDIEAVKTGVLKWQSVFGMEGWTIYVSCIPRVYLDENEVAGLATPHPENLQAEITISSSMGDEKTIVHEMLHVLFSEMMWAVNEFGGEVAFRLASYFEEQLVIRLTEVIWRMDNRISVLAKDQHQDIDTSET